MIPPIILRRLKLMYFVYSCVWAIICTYLWISGIKNHMNSFGFDVGVMFHSLAYTFWIAGVISWVQLFVYFMTLSFDKKTRRTDIDLTGMELFAPFLLFTKYRLNPYGIKIRNDLFFYTITFFSCILLGLGSGLIAMHFIVQPTSG